MIGPSLKDLILIYLDAPAWISLSVLALVVAFSWWISGKIRNGMGMDDTQWGEDTEAALAALEQIRTDPGVVYHDDIECDIEQCEFHRNCDIIGKALGERC